MPEQSHLFLQRGGKEEREKEREERGEGEEREEKGEEKGGGEGGWEGEGYSLPLLDQTCSDNFNSLFSSNE